MSSQTRLRPVMDRATACGPASLSNLGPGFDVAGIAIHGWGDRVEASALDSGQIEISYAECSLWSGTTDPALNTAGVAAERVLRLMGWEGGVRLLIEKGVVPGSGVGSSAASAVAAAWAVNMLFGTPLSKENLVGPVLAGEALASGAEHGDNVLPALFGDMTIGSVTDPAEFRRIVLPQGLFLAVVLPEIQILTREARGILPEMVPLSAAISNASNLALMVDAFRSGDWSDAGKRIMSDRIVEPVRSTLLPCYERVRTAAVNAGAYGCALSGSGPAMFAMAESSVRSVEILAVMKDAVRSLDIPVEGISTTANSAGAAEADRIVAADDAETV